MAEIRSSPTFVMYFIISLLHLSVPFAGVLHFSHDWFSYHVGPLRWPRSDLKAIKHQTFCGTRRPACSWAPCAAFLGKYDNNSMAVGVAESPAWGRGCSWTGSSRRLGGQGRVKVAFRVRRPLLPYRRLFPSCREQLHVTSTDIS